MKKMERWDCLFRGVEGYAGVISGILVLSVGLWTYGVQFQGAADMPGMLLTLFLASWIGVVGLGASALIPVWIFLRARTSCR